MLRRCPRSFAVTKNEGTIDRALRIVFGLVILALVVVGPKTPFGFLGLVPLVTGILGFCPLYRLVGLRTCPVTHS